MRDHELDRLTDALHGQPWAMVPEQLAILATVLRRRKAGETITAEQFAALEHNAANRIDAAFPEARNRDAAGMVVRQLGKVAIVPMFGTIVQRPSVFTKYCGATSAEQFTMANEELAADHGVSAIVWDVDSPGGSVAGVPEAADRLYKLRGKKPIVAVSNSLMASAAYWLASAADEVVASPSSLTGSIGVYTIHEDISVAAEKAGVRYTYIYAGKHKVDGNSHSPLSPEARDSMQQMVNDYYGQFVRSVARHRMATEREVRDGFGQGDTLTARRAFVHRLADRVGTLASVVNRFDPKNSSAMARAAARQLAARSAI